MESRLITSSLLLRLLLSSDSHKLSKLPLSPSSFVTTRSTISYSTHLRVFLLLRLACFTHYPSFPSSRQAFEWSKVCIWGGPSAVVALRSSPPFIAAIIPQANSGSDKHYSEPVTPSRFNLQYTAAGATTKRQTNKQFTSKSNSQFPRHLELEQASSYPNSLHQHLTHMQSSDVAPHVLPLLRR